MRKLTFPRCPYSQVELAEASAAWGCNCGPGALAAMLGLKPNDVRAHIPGFDAKRYVNPTMMKAALKSLGVPFVGSANPELCDYGLCRIQWAGPWTCPGVPVRVAYRKTHWIGAMLCSNLPWVFDINSGWQMLAKWALETVPRLTALYPGATGEWWPTHRWELLLP